MTCLVVESLVWVGGRPISITFLIWSLLYSISSIF